MPTECQLSTLKNKLSHTSNQHSLNHVAEVNYTTDIELL